MDNLHDYSRRRLFSLEVFVMFSDNYVRNTICVNIERVIFCQLKDRPVKRFR